MTSRLDPGSKQHPSGASNTHENYHLDQTATENDAPTTSSHSLRLIDPAANNPQGSSQHDTPGRFSPDSSTLRHGPPATPSDIGHSSGPFHAGSAWQTSLRPSGTKAQSPEKSASLQYNAYSDSSQNDDHPMLPSVPQSAATARPSSNSDNPGDEDDNEQQVTIIILASALARPTPILQVLPKSLIDNSIPNSFDPAYALVSPDRIQVSPAWEPAATETFPQHRRYYQ